MPIHTNEHFCAQRNCIFFAQDIKIMNIKLLLN